MRRPTRITGMKSGLKAAGEEFAYGVYDGVTGLVLQPYYGVSNLSSILMNLSSTNIPVPRLEITVRVVLLKVLEWGLLVSFSKISLQYLALLPILRKASTSK